LLGGRLLSRAVIRSSELREELTELRAIGREAKQRKKYFAGAHLRGTLVKHVEETRSADGGGCSGLEADTNASSADIARLKERNVDNRPWNELRFDANVADSGGVENDDGETQREAAKVDENGAACTNDERESSLPDRLA
jgi:hypothetical protein